jgi:hypothetical protein
MINKVDLHRFPKAQKPQRIIICRASFRSDLRFQKNRFCWSHEQLFWLPRLRFTFSSASACVSRGLRLSFNCNFIVVIFRGENNEKFSKPRGLNLKTKILRTLRPIPKRLYKMNWKSGKKYFHPAFTHKSHNFSPRLHALLPPPIFKFLPRPAMRGSARALLAADVLVRRGLGISFLRAQSMLYHPLAESA